MAGESPSGAAAESPAEAALARTMRCPPLSADALDHIRSAVASEWRAEHARRAQRPWWRRRRYAVAISFGLAILSAWWSMDRAASGEILGVVRSRDPVGLVVHRRLLPDIPLQPGASLRTGGPVTAVAATEVTLSDGGNLIVRQGAVFTVSPPQTIALQSGSVYVDFDPADRGNLIVRTPLGELRHVGTQFEVTVNDREERIAVREGTVRVTGHASTLVSAGQAIVLDDTGIKATEAVHPYDREWHWVEAATAAPTIEGETGAAFLRWLSRATGKRLIWADDEAAQLAARTTLHGSIENLAIDEAVGTVLGTTLLHARIDATTILVSAGPVANAAH